MVSYEEALKCVTESIGGIELATENIPLENSAGRILAENIISDIDMPAFTYSSTDGYGIAFSNHTSWSVIGEIGAGNFKQLTPAPGEAVMILSGSRVPDNIDTVIPLDDIIFEEGTVILKEGIIVRKGMNIRERGSDLVKDKIALRRFQKIEAKVITVLATCGIVNVPVIKKVRAGILGTGSELIAASEAPSVDKVRVSNIYALNAAAVSCGMEPVIFGFTKDDKEELRDTVQNALNSDIDILITTGGVSAGKFDYIKDIFDEAGIDIKYRKVNIKPGKPNIFGVYRQEQKRKYIFGLPGNPVSALAAFYIFIRPAVDSLYMQKNIDVVFAHLDADISKKDGKRHFMRGELTYDGNRIKVKPGYSQSSGNFLEMSKSNCLIEVPENVTGFVRGDIVKCIVM